ncbi:MAG: ABC transporter permease subunit [Myxococcota bacterium]|nr:ABC transporter permease subunit [Myxococcota bacterium]MDW8363740.1 ABC transporter permease subunit [Myxococcales bacterium]
MIGRIGALALNTFREAVRDRVLVALLAVACGVLLFTLALAELSLHEQRRVVHDVGLASISLFAVVAAVFLGSSMLDKEIERRTLYVILPKPVGRAELLLGKFAGIALTGWVFVGLMGGVQLWVMALQAGVAPLAVLAAVLGCGALLGLGLWRIRDRTALIVPWTVVVVLVATLSAEAGGVPLTPVLGALALTAAELCVLTAVALFFSSFSTPFLTGVLTVGVWILGRSAGQMATLKTRVLPEGVQAALRALAHVVPNFQLYVPGRRALEVDFATAGGAWTYVAMAWAYGLAYAAALLVFAAFVFRRRDLP